MKPKSKRSVQSRTGKGVKGLCQAWLKSMLCEPKRRTANEYDQHMQEAFEAITELQSIWRDWAYGAARSEDCLRRLSQVQFYIATDVWEHIKNDKQAVRMTQRYAKTLPYIAAMVEAITISQAKNIPFEERGDLLATRLSPGLFGEKRKIPREGSTVPDSLAGDGDYNYRWDSLPKHDWGSLD